MSKLTESLNYYVMMAKYYEYAPKSISIAGVRAMFKTVEAAKNNNPKLKAEIEKHLSEQEET